MNLTSGLVLFLYCNCSSFVEILCIIFIPEKKKKIRRKIKLEISLCFKMTDYLSILEAEEGNSWDVVSENDLWEGENIDMTEDDYVLVRQEDIVEGIACFMAAYLLSLKQTKVY